MKEEAVAKNFFNNGFKKVFSYFSSQQFPFLQQCGEQEKQHGEKAKKKEKYVIYIRKSFCFFAEKV